MVVAWRSQSIGSVVCVNHHKCSQVRRNYSVLVSLSTFYSRVLLKNICAYKRPYWSWVGGLGPAVRALRSVVSTWCDVLRVRVMLWCLPFPNITHF